MSYPLTKVQADQNATTYPAPHVAFSPFAAARRAAPNHVGPYRIEREIGRGGMGHVYLAVRNDQAYQKRVAIKILRRGSNARALEWRFKSERQILATLDHPNIARLLDGGTTEDGRPYFVMDYIEGERIDRYCDQQRLTIQERLMLFLQVCDAVQYAHRNLVVHRDIKPSNLLVTAEGVPKLLDFGIAKLLNPSSSLVGMEETVTGQHPMTPKYASPEQIRGQAITTASDVYSLGVLLYKLLTGRLPRQPDTLESLGRMLDSEPTSLSAAIYRAEEVPGGHQDDSDSCGVSLPETIAHLRRTPLQLLRHQLSGDLDRIAMMALRLEPERRYGSVEQLAEDIRRHLQGRPVSARADTFSYQCLKFIERHRWGVSAGAVVLSILLVFFGFMIQQTRAAALEVQHSAAQKVHAEVELQRSEAFTQLLIEGLAAGPTTADSSPQAVIDRSLDRLAVSQYGPAERKLLRQRLEQLRFEIGNDPAASRPPVNPSIFSAPRRQSPWQQGETQFAAEAAGEGR